MLDSFVLTIGFQSSKFDYFLYYQHNDINSDCVLVIVYDDTLLNGSYMKLINEMKITLNREFDMKDQLCAGRLP